MTKKQWFELVNTIVRGVKHAGGPDDMTRYSSLRQDKTYRMKFYNVSDRTASLIVLQAEKHGIRWKEIRARGVLSIAVFSPVLSDVKPRAGKKKLITFTVDVIFATWVKEKTTDSTVGYFVRPTNPECFRIQMQARSWSAACSKLSRRVPKELGEITLDQKTGEGRGIWSFQAPADEHVVQCYNVLTPVEV